MRTRRNELILLAIIAFLVAWTTLLYYVSPSEIVQAIGVRNAFLIVFLVSAIGGLSSFTAASFVLTVTTFAAGGANPYLIGLFAGFGAFLSDSAFFYAGVRGRKVLEEHWVKLAARIRTFVHAYPAWAVELLVFGYTGFVPLPNDPLTLSLALAKYPYRAIALPLWAGDTIFILIIALLAHGGLF